MTRLSDALRQKYKSPREALRALGLDENLISEAAMTTTNTDIAKKLNALAARQVTVGALVTYLKPRLAMDAKIPMAKVFDGITGKNFKEKKPAIAERIRTQAKDKLAKDVKLDDVEKVLDMLEAHEVDGGDESVSEAQHNAMEAAAQGHSNLDIPKKVASEFVDADMGKTFDAAAFGNFLKEKGLGEDDVSTAMGMLPKPAANDAEESEEDKKKREEEEKKKAEAAAKDAEMDKDKVSKTAMDAALKAHDDASAKRVTDAVAAERLNQRAIREALDAVRPYVGELAMDSASLMAMDSAEDIYRHTLGLLGVKDAKTIHASALKTILGMQKKPGAREPARTPVLAADASAVDSFAKRYPGSENIRSL